MHSVFAESLTLSQLKGLGTQSRPYNSTSPMYTLSQHFGDDYALYQHFAAVNTNL